MMSSVALRCRASLCFLEQIATTESCAKGMIVIPGDASCRTSGKKLKSTLPFRTNAGISPATSERFFGPSSAGYYAIGGTSEGSPQSAGIIADANQLAGHPLGLLNPKLYAIGASGQQSQFFYDITYGSNADDGPTVPGYLATPGWDLTTGWGTPNLAKLVSELVR